LCEVYAVYATLQSFTVISTREREREREWEFFSRLLYNKIGKKVIQLEE